jgi:hypothetical protein
MLIVGPDSMPDFEISAFVKACADEFFNLFPQFHDCAAFTRYDPEAPAAEFVAEPPAEHPSRLRSSLSYSANDRALNVSWDGCSQCMVIIPGFRDGLRAQREALTLFADIITGRRVSLSHWEGDICVTTDFPTTEDARQIIGRPDPDGYSRRVRSWSGAFDYDETAQPGAPPNGGPAEPLGNSGLSGGPPSVS